MTKRHKESGWTRTFRMETRDWLITPTDGSPLRVGGVPRRGMLASHARRRHREQQS